MKHTLAILLAVTLLVLACFALPTTPIQQAAQTGKPITNYVYVYYNITNHLNLTNWYNVTSTFPAYIESIQVKTLYLPSNTLSILSQ